MIINLFQDNPITETKIRRGKAGVQGGKTIVDYRAVPHKLRNCREIPEFSWGWEHRN